MSTVCTIVPFKSTLISPVRSAHKFSFIPLTSSKMGSIYIYYATTIVTVTFELQYYRARALSQKRRSTLLMKWSPNQLFKRSYINNLRKKEIPSYIRYERQWWWRCRRYSLINVDDIINDDDMMMVMVMVMMMHYLWIVYSTITRKRTRTTWMEWSAKYCYCWYTVITADAANAANATVTKRRNYKRRIGKITNSTEM
jgi:hypothetical protein